MFSEASTMAIFCKNSWQLKTVNYFRKKKKKKKKNFIADVGLGSKYSSGIYEMTNGKC